MRWGHDQHPGGGQVARDAHGGQGGDQGWCHGDDDGGVSVIRTECVLYSLLKTRRHGRLNFCGQLLGSLTGTRVSFPINYPPPPHHHTALLPVIKTEKYFLLQFCKQEPGPH